MSAPRLLARGSLALLAIFLGLPAASADPEIRAVDDRGREIALAKPAARIVSLAPHATELVFAAGAGDRLVGVTTYSDYPAAAKKIPQVGDFGKVDLERIARLRPDVVIAWKSGNHPGDLDRLEKLGLKVYVTEPRRLPDIPRLVRALGALAGTAAQADRAAGEFERRLAELKKRYTGQREVSMFYQIWHEPLMTVNREHIISDVIALCSGRNIFANAGALTPTVSAENVLTGNPEAIIASGALYNDERQWEAWRRFPQVKAVKNRRLFFIHPDLIQRPTPRLLEGAKQMCEQLDEVRRTR